MCLGNSEYINFIHTFVSLNKTHSHSPDAPPLPRTAGDDAAERPPAAVTLGAAASGRGVGDVGEAAAGGGRVPQRCSGSGNSLTNLCHPRLPLTTAKLPRALYTIYSQTNEPLNNSDAEGF
jgi:hypothetical protein